MDLPEKLEQLATSLDVWGYGNNRFPDDLRELLEEAAKRIRSNEAWIAHLHSNYLHQWSDMRSR